MINVKNGTQNWAPKSQEPISAHIDKSQTLSTEDRKTALGGDQNVGDVLNKVADANYVAPEHMRKPGSSALDKDAFLKLMLAQMKYQDPTNPMQNHEMAAQLAQFTSLEQLNNINSTLSGMSKSQTPTMNYQALNFIGKRVSGDSSKLSRVAGDTGHEFNFTLGSDAAKAEVKVMDEDGNVVRKMAMTNLKKGTNTIKWNGMDENSSSARPGDYHFSVEAASATGAKVYAKTEFNGKITGLNYTAQGPVLLVGQQAIRMQDVKKIEDAGNVSGNVSGADNEGQAPTQNLPLGLGASLGAQGPAHTMPGGSVSGALGAQANAQAQAMMAAMGMTAQPPTNVASNVSARPPAAMMAPKVEAAKDPAVKDRMAKNVAMSRAVMQELEKAKARGGESDSSGGVL